jgi:hypothetical protein
MLPVPSPLLGVELEVVTESRSVGRRLGRTQGTRGRREGGWEPLDSKRYCTCEPSAHGPLSYGSPPNDLCLIHRVSNLTHEFLCMWGHSHVLFSKTENKKVKQVLSGGWYQWEGGDIRKRCRRVNVVEMLCTHV